MTSAAEESTSTARYDMSRRLPIGVLTRYRDPAVFALSAFDELTPAGVSLCSLCRVLLELLRERGLADKPDHLIDELPILEEQDRRNRSDVELGGRLDVEIDVDLGNFRLAFVFDGELVENGGHHAAWCAPGRPKIDDGESLVLLDLGLEIRVVHFNCIRHFVISKPQDTPRGFVV